MPVHYFEEFMIDVDKLLKEFNKIESAKEQCLWVERNPLEATRIIWYLNAKAR